MSIEQAIAQALIEDATVDSLLGRYYENGVASSSPAQ